MGFIFGETRHTGVLDTAERTARRLEVNAITELFLVSGFVSS